MYGSCYHAVTSGGVCKTVYTYTKEPEIKCAKNSSVHDDDKCWCNYGYVVDQQNKSGPCILPTSTSTNNPTTTWLSYTKASQDLTKNTYGFGTGFPAGWWVNYQVNKVENKTRVLFDIAPPGWKIPDVNSTWLGYGTMSVDISPHYVRYPVC